ncbi:hypothetical protein [Duganella qianjiadongensis]|uniref:Uncharacterized protein n=1 Tax=Duganella qianjiadongensis TaxID=2692176 RepID=A0ABW9VRA3_9BURK|nr:hypothetical protein [Duganella qianjiadongensis]MYM41936.1 hypothetical protein [Duganella qianjiadongensis]
MNKSSLMVSRWFCAIALALSTPILSAAPQEPPLKCEVTHGAWCVARGIGEIKFVAHQNEQWNRWSLYDNYWKREVGVVLETPGCSDTVADRVELIKISPNVLWEGSRWKEAVISLRRDGTCELRLMVPLSDLNFVGKAASSLTGHIAACIAGRACTDNMLSAFAYKSLK